MKLGFVVALAAALAGTGCVTGIQKEALKDSLTLYASFDKGLNADYAGGDKTIYGAASGNRMAQAPAGLPEGGAVQVARGVGVTGDALKFTRKSSSVMFFKGPGNFVYQPTNWNGTVSFWLKLDPDRDLQPGYCDPIQLSAGNWHNGVFFAEFSKDETPRHFRFAMRPLEKIYNPKNLGWEAIPAKDRPMVQVEKPPFSREKWTHVAFTFENANTGEKNGVGKLYLDGQPAGAFPNWDLTVQWKQDEVVIIIGASYVGLFDDLALFDRALTAAEVTRLYGDREILKSISAQKISGK